MFVSLSPTYSVRNEANASFLIRVEKIIETTQDTFGAFSIPPFMGFILAHIGDEEFDASILTLSKRLNISPISIKKFVNQLIDNPEKKEFKYSNTQSIVLPSNLLTLFPHKPSPLVYEEGEINPVAEYVIQRPSVPLYANFMVTTACITDCLYCYANRTLTPTLNTEKIISVLKELHDQGTINVMLTGGDIFAYKDWEIILKEAVKYGYKPFLSTKTPLNKDKIMLLRDLGYEEIQFSLDSASSEILQPLVNVDSTYLDRVSSFLKHCSELKMNVLIRSVLTKKNASKEKLIELYTYLSQFSCVKEWVMTPAFFSQYKREHYKHLEVDNQDLIEAYNLSKEDGLAFRIGLNKISNNGYVLKRHRDVEEFVCQNQICLGNTTCLSILANGNCSVCEMLYDSPEYILGNVNNSTIREIWNSPKALDLYTMKQKEFPQSSSCKSCSVFEKCRNGFGKRVCYVDIAKSGFSKWDPDPRCPNSENIDLIL